MELAFAVELAAGGVSCCNGGGDKPVGQELHTPRVRLLLLHLRQMAPASHGLLFFHNNKPEKP